MVTPDAFTSETLDNLTHGGFGNALIGRALKYAPRLG
jgi:hypothetical protein